MTILYDLWHSQPTGSSKFHGGGEYIKMIFRALAARHGDSHTIIVYYDHGKFLDDWVKHILAEKNISSVDVKRPSDVEGIFATTDVDVFFCGMPSHLSDVFSTFQIPPGVRKIGVIHGLRFIEKPYGKYYLKYWFKNPISPYWKHLLYFFGYFAQPLFSKVIYAHLLKCLKTYDEIIAVSNHTKYSINAHVKAGMNNTIEVFYTPEKHKDDTQEDKSICADIGKYILMIGGHRWIKNVYRGILAIEDLFAKGRLAGMKVVIVGTPPPLVRKAMKHKDRYLLYDYVEPALLEELYRQCDIFVYPTLNEGFGMPPLEAMRYGKTCIVSAVCSLPELCGAGVYYVNPYDVKEIEARILQAVDMKIEPDTVKRYYEQTYQRQRDDLDRLCDFIAGAGGPVVCDT